jgi:prepilin-type N-terminal cleavage/methylation domain-containing protein|tara:strand:+ start:230 stop:697 length:468 start_codon:yes stop_codon:yes gene_type:complete
MTKHTSNKGFTLIELLIALLVFSVVVVAYSEAFSNTLRALERKATVTATNDALRFVRSQIILEPDLDAFEDGDEIETLDVGNARWEADVEPTEIPHLFQVALTIEFDGNDEIEDWTHEESIYLLRPTWSEIDESDELKSELQEQIEDGRNFADWQ